MANNFVTNFGNIPGTANHIGANLNNIGGNVNNIGGNIAMNAVNNNPGPAFSNVNSGQNSMSALQNIENLLLLQLHQFNTAKVVALDSIMYHGLGASGRAALIGRWSRVTRKQCVLVQDGHKADFLLGPLASFGLKNIYELQGVQTFFAPVEHEADDVVVPVPAGPSVRVPRPPNAFILYRKAHHAHVKTQNPGIHNNGISIIIGSMWRNEPQHVRDQYQGQAQVIKQRLMVEFPLYKYNPRKPGEKRRRNTRKAAAKNDGSETSASRAGSEEVANATPDMEDAEVDGALEPAGELDADHPESLSSSPFN